MVEFSLEDAQRILAGLVSVRADLVGSHNHPGALELIQTAVRELRQYQNGSDDAEFERKLKSALLSALEIHDGRALSEAMNCSSIHSLRSRLAVSRISLRQARRRGRMLACSCMVSTVIAVVCLAVLLLN
jgi:hypothetical protein